MVESGAAPRAVCSRHGLPAAATRRVKLYSRSPWWVWLLMLAGWLVALIVAVALRKIVAAPAWPFCDRCEDRRRAAVLGVVVTLGVSAVSLFLSIATLDLWFLALTFAGILAALALAAQAGWGVIAGAVVSQDRAAVVLRRPALAYTASLPPYPHPRVGVR
jgi:hypothetical protein